MSNVTILIENEGHTLGNTLRKQIIKNNDTIFAAYRIPHPLKQSVEFRLQTTIDYMTVINNSINELCEELDDFNTAFSKALNP